MKWLNALALLLQFLAFWFAAPELLGEQTLKRFERGLRKLMAVLPMVVLMSIVVLYSITFSAMGIIKGLDAAENKVEAGEMFNYYMVLGIAFMVYIVFMIFFKRMRNWLDLHLAQPLSHKLIHQTEMRKNALIVGAILFTTGFLLQFIIILI